MPTSQERVPNRALSGAELKELLRRDFERLLANDGLLSDYISFGRIAYTIILRKHLDNFLRPEDVTAAASARQPNAAIAEHPGLAAVEPPPLVDSSADAIDLSTSVSRTIASPNEERIRAGLPIPVERRQQDSSLVTENIVYPPQPELGDGDVTLDMGVKE